MTGKADGSRRGSAAVNLAVWIAAWMAAWIAVAAARVWAEPVAATGDVPATVPVETAAVTGVPADFSTFLDGIGRDVFGRLGCTDKHWRQISPALHHLTLQHADALAKLADDRRVATLAALAALIDSKREAAGKIPVLAPGRTVIGLLDPAQGLGRNEITAIADAYDCESTVFKQEQADQTIAGIGAEFLAAVTAAVTAGKPTSVIVLGHGLPTEIQSYHIRFERLAQSLLDGAEGSAAVDLSRVVIVCDDCFSADFHINLLAEIAKEAARRGRPLASLPVCIAGTNRNRVGHADVGEKFVPHFWRDVIELYFIRRPLPEAVTLANFFGNVDNMMYGYGRAPIVEDGRVAGYRLVNPELVQDPVVFVPLDEADLVKLREILGLPADAPLPRWLDVG